MICTPAFLRSCLRALRRGGCRRKSDRPSFFSLRSWAFARDVGKKILLLCARWLRWVYQCSGWCVVSHSILCRVFQSRTSGSGLLALVFLFAFAFAVTTRSTTCFTFDHEIASALLCFAFQLASDAQFCHAIESLGPFPNSWGSRRLVKVLPRLSGAGKAVPSCVYLDNSSKQTVPRFGRQGPLWHDILVMACRRSE